MRKHTTWSRVFLALIVLALLVVHAYQPSLAEEIENPAQEESVQGGTGEEEIRQSTGESLPGNSPEPVEAAGDSSASDEKKDDQTKTLGENDDEESNVPASASLPESNGDVDKRSSEAESDRSADEGVARSSEVQASNAGDNVGAEQKESPDVSLGLDENAESPSNDSNEEDTEDKDADAGDEADMLLMSSTTLPEAFKDASVIYLDGVHGDDECFGVTKENAVKTFARAKELAAANQGIKTIYVMGTVPITGELSLGGTNAVLKREPSFKGYLLQVASGTTATLKNIVIDGNSEEAAGANSSLINCPGTLNIAKGTVLQNNKIGSKSARRSGGAVYSSGGTINMLAGLIQNNSATFGGGIYLCRNATLHKNATLNMSGGTIQNNQVINGPDMGAWNDAAAGGGVCLFNGATFNLSGGTIQKNSSEEMGGGVSVGTMEASLGNNRMKMTGGTIDGNTSRATGGGIFIQAGYGGRESSATITGGNITKNRMLGTGVTNYLFGGGGIYVNGYKASGFNNGHLILKNVVISGNEARRQGGGYAGCPITNTKTYLTDGAAIFNNSASSARDVFIYAQTIGFGAHGGAPEYIISPMMLGDVPYHWKYSNGTEVPLNELRGKLSGEGVSLGLHTDEKGNANTNARAKVYITGNYSATRGGGIGSNGDITIGKEDPTVDIQIVKTWDDNSNAGGIRPSSVEIEIWGKFEGGDPFRIGYETIKPDQNGAWTLTVTKLPKYGSNGKLINYSIKERKVNGYEAEITGDVASGFKVRNCLKSELKTEIEGTKTWVDSDNQDGKRPNSITINLYKKVGDGEVTFVKSQAVSADANGDWTWTFAGLPKYEGETEIVYSITEDEVDGYTTTVNGYDVTNTYMPETLTISGSKTWIDNNNQDGKRPESIKINLYKQVGGGEVTFVKSQTVTPDANGDWVWTFADLPKYEAGKEIVYTITEDEVEGYDSDVVGYNVTNTHTPETLTVSGSKTWADNNDQDGKRPESIKINLHKQVGDGKVTFVKSQTVTPDANGDWTWTFADLPKYEAGKEIVYSITEDEVEGYDSDVVGYNVTNTHEPSKTSVKVTKDWVDNNNEAGLRPESVTIKLYADGEDTGKQLVLSEETGWIGEFSELDQYKDGDEIVYSIEESELNDWYTSLVSRTATNAYTVTNSIVQSETVITVWVTKSWDDANDQDGIRPDSIMIHLCADGEEVDSKEITASDGWEGAFVDLPKYKNGKEIVYTIQEGEVDGYTTTVDGYDVTNTHEPSKISVKVTKDWIDHNNEAGIRPETITVRLYADGEDTGKKLVLSEDVNWTGVFIDLDAYKNGNKIDYTVEEDEVEGYTAEETAGNMDEGFVIRNCPVLGEKTDDGSIPKTGESMGIYWIVGIGLMITSVVTLFFLVLRQKGTLKG
ncbi:MAG TPA: Cna B-type domain-containing protein [Clostridiaceae bacterium]|nr:Cna B-type domain-containing protein [Clostridiaceae bacterium]